MNIREPAAASGMQVTLDARIGLQEYQGIHGSLQALLRFANAVKEEATDAASRVEPAEAEASVCPSYVHERKVQP